MAAYEIHIGDTIEWKWGSGTGSGTDTDRFPSKVTRAIDGAEVTRDASEEGPAYLIEQGDGAIVLKSSTELN